MMLPNSTTDLRAVRVLRLRMHFVGVALFSGVAMLERCAGRETRFFKFEKYEKNNHRVTGVAGVQRHQRKISKSSNAGIC